MIPNRLALPGRGVRRRLVAIATALTLPLLLVPSVAFADQLIGTTIFTQDLCVGQTYEFNLTGTFRRSGTGPQYPDGATLTITQVSASLVNGTFALVSINDATAILPADWTSQSFPFAASDTVNATVSLTPTAPGDLFGSIEWQVSINNVPFATPFAAVLVQDAIDCDADNDGVADADDVCPGTVLPEAAPPQLKKNHYAANAAGEFIDGTGADSGITVADTGGCSGAQIIAEAGLGKGHTKYGISAAALASWDASH